MKKTVLRRACFLVLPLLSAVSCVADSPAGRIPPLVVTEPTLKDSDDPAIWVHPTDPAQSLVIGTDKDEQNGGLYAFDLKGKIVKTVLGMKRPNNVDLVYGLMLGGKPVDVAVMTERNVGKIRVVAVPSMEVIDGGGLPVFDIAHDKERLPTGIALYKRPRDGAIFAIVGAREGPKEGYLWQYRLEDDGKGQVRATKVREFGAYSGTKEIEAIAVDNELGHVYYSDERFGVRQYQADPDAPDANRELGSFGTDGFFGDREGISIYPTGPRRGYIIVSNQDGEEKGNSFRIFRREGEPGKPYAHPFLKEVKLSTESSDGSDVTTVDFGGRFPGGLFVAMSTDRTFHYYSWQQIAGRDLQSAPRP
jgi:3-phytase